MRDLFWNIDDVDHTLDDKSSDAWTALHFFLMVWSLSTGMVWFSA